MSENRAGLRTGCMVADGDDQIGRPHVGLGENRLQNWKHTVNV